MTEDEFIREIAGVLRAQGYRKNRKYWYRARDGYTECVNVQGSQWDKDAYSVEIGLVLPDPDKRFPPVWEWQVRHMIIGRGGQYNITPDELYRETDALFAPLTSAADIPARLAALGAQKIGGTRVWYEY